MGSLLTQELQRDLERDRLRVAGYRTPDITRPRRAGLRRTLGSGLIWVGERLRGCTRQPVGTVTAVRRP